MNAIELTAPSLDKLSEVKHDNPAEPGPGRILVRMKAASLNFLDLAVAKGADPGVVYPIVPLADGADLVVESVGGESFGRSVAAVRQGGTGFTIDFLGGTVTQLDLLPVITKEVCIQASNGGSVADLASAGAIAAHRIAPVIDRSFAAGLTEAYRFMEKGGHFGKITVRLDW